MDRPFFFRSCANIRKHLNPSGACRLKSPVNCCGQHHKRSCPSLRVGAVRGAVVQMDRGSFFAEFSSDPIRQPTCGSHTNKPGASCVLNKTLWSTAMPTVLSTPSSLRLAPRATPAPVLHPPPGCRQRHTHHFLTIFCPFVGMLVQQFSLYQLPQHQTSATHKAMSPTALWFTHAQRKRDEMMNRLTALWNRFRNEESGATMVEYGLIVALVAVVAIGAVSLLGTDVSAEFKSITDSIGS